MIRSTFSFAALLLCLGSPLFAKEADERTPNVVIIFIDDMGYADIGPFGATEYPTPNLDQMAAEGRIFTDFHSATGVCSASRAALLTGCYPERVSILGALFPNAKIGLHSEELTIAELCKQRDYATAVFGKWHLGHLEPFLPMKHGFDEYLCLPYSNDMWPHPDVPDNPKSRRRKKMPPLPLLEGDQTDGDRVANPDVTAEDQAQLTTLYTQRAVDFIERNQHQPFFLYVPHTMVHVPIFVSDKFAGKSGAGLYGDVVMELDWSVGEILAALKRTGVDEDTLVIFTSDNGPWLNYGNYAGSAGPLREGKGTMFEGGYREPCVMRWPGKIPAGTKCGELSSTMDLLPTMARLIGGELPSHPIDGKDIWPLIIGEDGAVSPHDAFYCYYGRELQAVRDRRWKLHLPHKYRTLAGKPPGKDGFSVRYEQAKIGRELFDLRNDIGETTNVAEQHPEIVEQLLKHAEQARQTLGDKLTGAAGTEVRPHGTLAPSN